MPAKRRGVYWLTTGPAPYLATCARCGKHEIGPEMPTPLKAALLFFKYLIEKHRHCKA